MSEDKNLIPSNPVEGRGLWLSCSLGIGVLEVLVFNGFGIVGAVKGIPGLLAAVVFMVICWFVIRGYYKNQDSKIRDMIFMTCALMYVAGVVFGFVLTGPPAP